MVEVEEVDVNSGGRTRVVITRKQWGSYVVRSVAPGLADVSKWEHKKKLYSSYLCFQRCDLLIIVSDNALCPHSCASLIRRVSWCVFAAVPPKATAGGGILSGKSVRWGRRYRRQDGTQFSFHLYMNSGVCPCFEGFECVLCRLVKLDPRLGWWRWRERGERGECAQCPDEVTEFRGGASLSSIIGLSELLSGPGKEEEGLREGEHRAKWDDEPIPRFANSCQRWVSYFPCWWDRYAYPACIRWRLLGLNPSGCWGTPDNKLRAVHCAEEGLLTEKDRWGLQCLKRLDWPRRQRVRKDGVVTPASCSARRI